MKYFIDGPYALPRLENNGSIPRSKKDWTKWWKEVVDPSWGVSSACGVYVFGIRAGGGTKVYYVGKANRQSFRSEASSVAKVAVYNECLGYVDKGTPVLFFVARCTPNNEYCRPARTKAGHKDIDFLETFLMAAALRRNRDLANVRGLKFLRDVSVPGLVNNSSKLTKSAKALKGVLGL